MSHVDDRLAPFVAGELSDEDNARIEAHLAGCGACRGLAEDVRRGHAWASLLEQEPLPLEAQARLRRALANGRRRGRTPRLAIAAGLALVAGGAWFAVRGGAVLAPAAAGSVALRQAEAAPTPFEAAALALHAQHRTGGMALDFRSASVPEVRGWVESATGLGVSLAVHRPPEEARRFVLEGARRVSVEGVRAAAVAYRVGDRPVTLLTAAARDVPDRAAAWSRFRKNVDWRVTPDGQLLTWTNSGQVYALVSELPGYGQQACFVCHTDAARRATIEALRPTP